MTAGRVFDSAEDVEVDQHDVAIRLSCDNDMPPNRRSLRILNLMETPGSKLQ
jgi:hypothetical protein